MSVCFGTSVGITAETGADVTLLLVTFMLVSPLNVYIAMLAKIGGLVLS
jgi:hypothetical protein